MENKTESDEASFDLDGEMAEEYGLDDTYSKERANSCASQLTQSDLSRLGMLTAIGDPGIFITVI